MNPCRNESCVMYVFIHYVRWCFEHVETVDFVTHDDQYGGQSSECMDKKWKLQKNKMPE